MRRLALLPLQWSTEDCGKDTIGAPWSGAGIWLRRVAALSTEAYDPDMIKCPACDFEMTEFTLGGITIDACHGGCGGIWFDAFELQRLDERHELPDQHVLRIQINPDIEVDFSRKRSCPRCDGVKLQRHFYSPRLEVEVDHCPGCGGYWLDAGEFERIRDHMNAPARVSATARVELTMETIRFIYRQKLEFGDRD